MGVIQALAKLPDNSVDCIITSPPYYGLRNYNNVSTHWGEDWVDIDSKLDEDRESRELGLSNIGIDLNPSYIEIIKRRLHTREWLDKTQFEVIR